ncbi:putative Ultrabithorax [Planoprotostelium fungivorum]|uniref:Putative Ultrabithorax n=1 Tax=Planoprotostelium fungivorum TaxID=1890364 RepID=A0A2P6NMC5_9EUKA|nr:putative Ultrabithorax [Planoprotostelium fungivorum]
MLIPDVVCGTGIRVGWKNGVFPQPVHNRSTPTSSNTRETMPKMQVPFLTTEEKSSPSQRLVKPEQRYFYFSVDNNEGWKMKDPQRHKLYENPRRIFSIYHQLELLELFRKTHYPSRAQKEALATKFGVSERQIQIWFQNRRARTGKNMEDGQMHCSPAINMRVTASSSEEGKMSKTLARCKRTIRSRERCKECCNCFSCEDQEGTFRTKRVCRPYSFFAPGFEATRMIAFLLLDHRSHIFRFALCRCLGFFDGSIVVHHPKKNATTVRIHGWRVKLPLFSIGLRIWTRNA